MSEKAILVIDFPKVSDDFTATVIVGKATRTYEDNEGNADIEYLVSDVYRHVPLKPIPEKLTMEEYGKKYGWIDDPYYAVEGYNRCIDEIMGEENG